MVFVCVALMLFVVIMFALLCFALLFCVVLVCFVFQCLVCSGVLVLFCFDLICDVVLLFCFVLISFLVGCVSLFVSCSILSCVVCVDFAFCVAVM